MRSVSALVFAALVSLGPASSCADPLSPPKVDMERMYGGWYMIATLPNWFEKGIVAPYDVYSKRPDGDLQEDFTFRPGGFAAPLKHFTVRDWVLPNTNNAHWRVQVFWPLDLPFLVLWVDPEYRYVIFGEDDRKLGWIFSRTQDIPEADYLDLLRRFDALGYDRDKLVKFVQRPEQIGMPGYWSDGITQ
jgi:apolipoprotein D and lipocalin family protein